MSCSIIAFLCHIDCRCADSHLGKVSFSCNIHEKSMRKKLKYYHSVVNKKISFTRHIERLFGNLYNYFLP